MEPARNDGLGKLLPRAITEKRRRRKQRQRDGASNLHTMVVDSDGTNSLSNMGDDDDYDDDYDSRSFRDDGSYGSFESGPEPDSSLRRNLSAKGSKTSSLNPSRAASRSPSRPNAVSQRPPPSPIVQPARADTQSTSSSPSQPPPAQAVKPASTGSIRPASDVYVLSTPTQQPPIGPSTPAKAATPSSLRSRATTHADRSSLPSLALPPNIANTSSPAIVSTPPTPTKNSPSSQQTPSLAQKAVTWKALGFSNTDGPTSRALNAHKRSASASATALASDPLTPPLESTPTTNSGTGFFSSMLSAAQNAANNFSANIQNSSVGLVGASLPKDGSGKQAPTSAETEPASQREQTADPPTQPAMDQKESAIRTLGAGDLSLSQLGVAEPPSPVASPMSAKFADMDSTRARSESAPADTQTSNGEFMPEEAGSSSRPRSLIETPSRDVTPPLPQIDTDDKYGLQHSGSVRSNQRGHRKRGSSVTTSGTGMNMGMPLAGVTSPVPHAAANLSTPKLTGFAIASKKRNRDFHTVFKSVPDDDYLIEDYSCALQREILAHGRLYVSEGHLCFSSNILGWTTTLVMSFDEIVSVEKRSTALVFKNGLMVSTLHAKHVFASFTSRDATYDLIVNIWKLGHPTLTSTLNGVQVEGTGGDKTEKVDAEPSLLEEESQLDSGSDDESREDGEEFYVEDDVDGAASDGLAEINGDGELENGVPRKTSGMTTNGIPGTQGKDSSPLAGLAEFLGPATHPPTECTESSTHYDKVVGDDVIPAPLGKVHNLLFGQDSVQFMSRFLSHDSKCTEVQFEDKKGLTMDSRNRTYTYVKPLNSTLGPKQAKCIITETLDAVDFEKSVSVTMSTQTPEVPSGNLFLVKTRYCLTWAENNHTRMFVNCTIEWSGKSWIKGPIEKAAADGQVEYCKNLNAALKAGLASRSRAGTGTNGAAKAKKKGKKSKVTQLASQAAEVATPKRAASGGWGALEPVRPFVEPLADLVKPLLTGNVMYGLLVGLLVAAWFGFGLSPSRDVGPYSGALSGVYGPDRIAAYDEMWRREESELWDWLEERVGMERLAGDGGNVRKTATRPRTAEEKMRQERMNMREMEEAMRVTQEKLRALEETVRKVSTESGRAVYDNI